MSHIEKLERHERLMTRMADRNGADVSLAEQIGLVAPEEIFAATQACTGCTAVENCETHLETGARGMPDYCRNQDLIRRLFGELSDLGLSET